MDVASADLITVQLVDPVVESVSCPICWTIFDSGGEKDKVLPAQALMLPCGHTVCRSCLERIKESVAAVRVRIICPLCKALHTVSLELDPLKQFPRNFALETTAEIVSKWWGRLVEKTGGENEEQEGEGHKNGIEAVSAAAIGTSEGSNSPPSHVSSSEDGGPEAIPPHSAAPKLPAAYSFPNRLPQPTSSAPTIPSISDRAVFTKVIALIEANKRSLTLEKLAEQLEREKAWPPAGFLKRVIETQKAGAGARRGAPPLQAQLLRRPTLPVLRAFVESCAAMKLADGRGIAIQRQPYNLTPVVAITGGVAVSTSISSSASATSGSSASASAVAAPRSAVATRGFGSGHAFSSVSDYMAHLEKQQQQQEQHDSCAGEAAADAALGKGAGGVSAAATGRGKYRGGGYDDDDGGGGWEDDSRYFAADRYEAFASALAPRDIAVGSAGKRRAGGSSGGKRKGGGKGGYGYDDDDAW